LIGQITFKQGASVRMTTTKQYDFLNRLTSVSSVPSGSPPVNSAYDYNLADQRTRNIEADGSYWRYQYDPLGQVKAGTKYWPDQTPVAGQQFGYAFDDIGNRVSTTAGGDDTGANLRSANYYVNNLNQYTSRDVPGIADVMGVDFTTNTVTVAGLAPYRKGEYFRKEISVNNGATPVWTNIIVSATGQSSVSGNVFVPTNQERKGVKPLYFPHPPP
jgi:YD repeat-containing protein